MSVANADKLEGGGWAGSSALQNDNKHVFSIECIYVYMILAQRKSVDDHKRLLVLAPSIPHKYTHVIDTDL